MRELLFKNLVSKDKKRTELLLSEHFEGEGLVQDIEKRTVYRVKEILEFTDTSDLELFLSQKNKDNSPPRRFIIKSRTTRTATNKFIYKIVGEQFVVLNDKVFRLEVSQCLKKVIIHKNKNEKSIA